MLLRCDVGSSKADIQKDASSVHNVILKFSADGVVSWQMANIIVGNVPIHIFIFLYMLAIMLYGQRFRTIVKNS